jgi:hypothetical protein
MPVAIWKSLMVTVVWNALTAALWKSLTMLVAIWKSLAVVALWKSLTVVETLAVTTKSLTETVLWKSLMGGGPFEVPVTL